MSRLEPTAAWRLLEGSSSGKVHLVNKELLLPAGDDGVNFMAILQVPPGQQIRKGTRPIVVEGGCYDADWVVQPVQQVGRPVSDGQPDNVHATCPSRFESAGPSGAPPGPHIAPSLWAAFQSDATENSFVWFATLDNRWISDGNTVRPYIDEF